MTLGSGHSVYRWKGRVQSSSERQLIIKTTRRCLPRLERRLTREHPYELPELAVLSVTGGSSAYLEWVGSACAS